VTSEEDEESKNGRRESCQFLMETEGEEVEESESESERESERENEDQDEDDGIYDSDGY
jgi:hypothetical protein